MYEMYQEVDKQEWNEYTKSESMKPKYGLMIMDCYLAWFLDIFSCGQEEGQDIVSSKAGISLSLQYNVAIQYA